MIRHSNMKKKTAAFVGDYFQQHINTHTFGASVSSMTMYIGMTHLIMQDSVDSGQQRGAMTQQMN